MEITVLGRYGPYAAPDGAASSYLVREGTTALLLDMGAGTFGRLQKFADIKDLTAIYFTHLHFDHTSDFLGFRYRLEEINHKVKVFAPLMDTPWSKLLFGHELFDVTDTSALEEITVGGFRCRLFKTEHTLPNFGIRITGAKEYGSKTLVYTGDAKFSEVIEEMLVGADLAVGDFSKPPKFSGPHMSVEDTVRLHEKTGVKILASHLGPDYDPTDYFKDYPEITVAEEMKTYKV